VRFEDRLRLRLDVPLSLRAKRIPPLLVQPLVENAIKHGIAGRAGAIWVQSTLERNDRSSNLVLTIRDNGAGLPVRNAAELRLGVGLGSTKERLMRMYDRQSLEIQPLPEGGTEVRIVLPANHPGRIFDAAKTATENVSDRTPAHHG
jgi:two-component system, LytTR family, sensor kinase